MRHYGTRFEGVIVDPNERIENLINRKLDGELTEEDRLELDRALIKSPEHRAMLELSERIDLMCAETIAEGVSANENDAAGVLEMGASRLLPTSSRGGASRRRSWWWAMPAALAACVGWLAFSAILSPQPAGDGLQLVGSGPVSGAGELTPTSSSVRAMDGNGMSGAIRQASTRGRTLDRRRDTQLLGVMGDDGRIYLIEVTRTQAYSRPSARSGARLALEGL